MEIRPYGDRALLVEFEQIIDPQINDQVLQLDQFLLDQSVEGLEYTIPAYCSLVVSFDPTVTSFHDLSMVIRNSGRSSGRPNPKKYRNLLIPVCYHSDFGLDLKQLASDLNLDIEEVVEKHSATTFQVYMLGFLPGFAYMGKVDQALNCKRKNQPRKAVPAQSVGLAGAQTGIYPQSAPGGWQIIGRTPLKPFDNNSNEPFLFRPGDRVRFDPISRKRFFEIEQLVNQGQYDLKHFDG